MRYTQLFIGSVLIAGLFTACNNESKPAETTTATTPAAPAYKEETVTYTGDGISMNGYVVYDDSNKNKRPAVLVVHEWWGLNDYPKMRAKQLAELGYVAMAIDMYGDGKIADNPDSAKSFAGPLYMNPQKAKARIDAAIAKLKTYGIVDTANIAAIGYCFGGGMLLNTARLGDELKGVVSFHGTLLGTPARKDLLKTKLLVLHGNDDKFVLPKEVAAFKKQMDSIGASYKFVGYDSATHAFTNPASTPNGLKYKMPIAYNAKADSASWNEMKSFFTALFH
ncbi:MAG TPA: dienelactone hydrolase family protein [Puia sp.]|nr:dienelactone hydrolase family protein [Puia sp.]